MLESTLGINVAVIICICYIINGLCLHCFILKWFFNDITNHLFHFLNENHIHAICNENISLNFNNSAVEFNISLNADEHSHFNSKYLLHLSELLTNIIYFLYITITTLFLTKLRTNQNSFNCLVDFFSSFATNDSNRDGQTANSTSNFIYSINEPTSVNLNSKQLRNKLYRNIFVSVFYYALLLFILIFTFSASSIRLHVKCEDFFKNNSKMVSTKFVELFCN